MLYYSSTAYAQRNSPYMGEIKAITNAMKETKNISYTFSLSAEFPNGETDEVNGEVYVGNDDRIMYNSNDAFTVLYTEKYFYKADHKTKTVVIVNLEKHMNKEVRKSIESDMFGQNALSAYLDSVVLKNAWINNLRKSNDTILATLSFPAHVSIKAMDIIFDEKNKAIVKYSVRMFEPWKTNEFGKNKGTTKVIIADNFKKVDNSKK